MAKFSDLPQCSVFLQKVTLAKIVRKFPPFIWSNFFCTITRALQWSLSWVVWIRSI